MVLAGLTWCVVLGSAADAQTADDPAALNAEIMRLYQAGRYTEATEIAKRLLAIREKALGPNDPAVGSALNTLAMLYRAQGRFAEAEPLFKHSLSAREKALGPDHPDVGWSLSNLASLYIAQGRFAEAEPLLKRTLAIREKALGPDHADVGSALNNLAMLYAAQGRVAEAEPLFKSSIAIHETALGADHPAVGTLLNNLARFYQDQGRFGEAAPLFKRGLAIREKTLGLDHPGTGELLNNLATLYQMQGRFAEAEPLFKRSLAIREKSLGPDHPDVGIALNNLAARYKDEGRLAEAEPLFRRSIAIWEKALGPDHPELGAALDNLAALYLAQGRLAEAEPLIKRSLAISEKASGSGRGDMATPLSYLGALYSAQGRLGEAEPLYRRSLSIYEMALGHYHPIVGAALSNLASLAFDQEEWARAVEYWRRSTAIIKRRAERGLSGIVEGAANTEALRARPQFTGLIKASHSQARRGRSAAASAAEMFQTAQWALASDAAASLAQMAARSAKGSPELSALVRERQDLVSEWDAKDKLLIAAKSEPPANRKAGAEKALVERLAEIETRLSEIGQRFAQDFPDYAALASPTPASVAEVQAQLGTDEALVLFLVTPERKPLPEESFIWVVTKSDVRWVRSDLGTAALTREVVALRCGLDADAWEGKGAERCTKALGIAPVKGAPNPLPFDHARAHKLYMGLFGQVQDLIKGKHLLIVPSGPLTQLPFQVLMTGPPTSGDHRAAAWLAREHAITVLPAVSSLKALRRVGKPSVAARPMVGFGNPLLDGYHGQPNDDAEAAQMAKDHAQRAKEARTKQRCPETHPQRVAARSGPHRGGVRVETRGLANVALLKEQLPLPETADELCTVAQAVKADAARDIHLGSQATEREVKHLSASGKLSQYRMIHFATHGALAGELGKDQEPGLILTPPATATEEDDGYLSASEIAALKLDADWVILSACNTATGGATNAEALSGLARAFIYAGARSLLVSHWAVYSDATVKLITGAVREMARDPKVGRAEAMRRSMLALIDKGTQEEAHPAFWAPFVAVGEGAAGR
jgi:CHAT domain-containing protein/Flp pilus assembly protein TadD